MCVCVRVRETEQERNCYVFEYAIFTYIHTYHIHTYQNASTDIVQRVKIFAYLVRGIPEKRTSCTIYIYIHNTWPFIYINVIHICIYMYMCTQVKWTLHASEDVWIYRDMEIYRCTDIQIYKFINAHTHIYIYIYMYVYMYVYVCVCAYIYIYIYTVCVCKRHLEVEFERPLAGGRCGRAPCECYGDRERRRDGGVGGGEGQRRV